MGFCLKATATNRWPKGIVRYGIDPAAFPTGPAITPAQKAARQQLILAINGWNTSSVVKLLAAAPTDSDLIWFTTSGDAGACSSRFGRQGGSQPVSCRPGAAAGIIMHEIGHALGLLHEHMRPDRDSFITVNNGNIQLVPIDRTSQFNPKQLSQCPVGSYDCGSIMHYGSTSFSVDGVKPTITVTNPAICQNIGQRNALSAGDLAAVRVMYDSITGFKNKVTLGEDIDAGPAIAFHNNSLFLAWKGSGNDNLNVILSDDGGVTFHGKHTSPETSDDSPALASHNERLFIAFKGSGNDNINVAVVNRSTSGSQAVASISSKVVLSDTTDGSPAIASHNGSLYIAFKGSGNDNLNVMVSRDNGATFTGKHTSSETSSDSPTLVSSNGQLYIGWKGSGNENFNVATVNVGPNPASPAITGFSNKVVFGDTTEVRPALAEQGGLLFISWKGAGNDNFNLMFPADHDGCTHKFITSESSSHAPALASHADQMWIAWKGSGNDALNVALVDFASQGADAAAVGVTAMNNDLFNQLVQIETTLSTSFENLSQGLSVSLTQQHFTNNALMEKIAQEKTMICQLEQIAQRTCDLLSEAHVETGLQQGIAKDVKRLLEIARTANPGAELELQRLDRLQSDLERCCPPEVEPPRCTHEPCPQPPDFGERPPPVDYRPIPQPPPLHRHES
jgi:hypothetical protein